MEDTASELVAEFGKKAAQKVVDRIVSAVRDKDIGRQNGLNELLKAVERELAAQTIARRCNALPGTERSGFDVRA